MKSKYITGIIFITLLIGCSQPVPQTKIKSYHQFEKLNITQITPQGWIKEFLQRQASGLTGNIEVAGYPFSTCLWACEKMEGSTKAWWPYEQTAYYLDGVHRLGLLLSNEELIGRARTNTEYVLNNIRSDGRFGTNLADRWWRWPYASFNRILMTQFEVTGDQKIIDALANHYRTFTPQDFCDDLELANVEQLCWLYDKTADTTFLNMAIRAYDLFKSDIIYRNRSGQHGPSDMNFGSDRVPDHHGVVYLELAKIPALLYKYTGQASYLKEAENALAKMERHHSLAGGLPSTTEHFEPTSETAGYEICNTAVFPYTYGHLLRISGDATLADKIEKAVFNAGIGSITKDFKAHQYFSAPNQAIASAVSNPFGHHPARMAFLPGHDVECCTGNVNRFMPYFVEQMWFKTKDHGLVANVFGPSAVVAHVGSENHEINVEVTTNYPFAELIAFKIATSQPVRFPFLIRIPTWCKTPLLTINGESVDEVPKPGRYYRLDRRFEDGDIIELKVPMPIETKTWAGRGLSVERGPLTFSLPIRDSRTKFGLKNKSTEAFPGWELFPEDEWNYALEGSNFEVIQTHSRGYPWEEGNAPIKLKASARKVLNWQLQTFYDDYFNIKTIRTPSFPEPLELSETTESLELIPYGNTLLRITIFPNIEQNE